MAIDVTPTVSEALVPDYLADQLATEDQCEYVLRQMKDIMIAQIKRGEFEEFHKFTPLFQWSEVLQEVTRPSSGLGSCDK